MTRQEAKLVAQEMLKLQKEPKAKEDKTAENRVKSEKWFKDKLKIGIVKRDLTIPLPTKKGVIAYDGVLFDNGKTGVYLKSGFLKYAWA